VLVVGMIVGALSLLLNTRSHHNSTAAIPVGGPAGAVNASPVTSTVRAGNLEASLQITPDPYFLSELLAVGITLTNHGQQSILLQGNASINFCTAAFAVTITGGGKPDYTLPVNADFMSCPFTETKIVAGKTFTAHGYVPLLQSGQVTITVDAKFLKTVKDVNGGSFTTNGSSPLDGHWPVLHINVAAQIPADRILSLQQQGSQVIIQTPTAIQSQLLYFYSFRCTGEGGTNGMWRPLTALTLHEPDCSGADETWAYAVGAPGYAIVSGEVSP
jgi:hypothetical protein